MADSRIATDKVLEWEGVLIEDVKDDAGGLTCCGISSIHKEWPGWVMIANYRSAGVSDDTIVKKPDVMNAVLDFYGEWFHDLLLDRVLDQKKANQIFQLCVNAGNERGIKFVQEIVNVVQDGVIGMVTISAINAASPGAFCNNLCKRQELFYNRICQKDPTQNKFLSGWLKRAEAFA